MLEGRIAELEATIATLEIFEGPVTTDVVGFCSYVTIKDIETGKRRTVQLVSEHEANINSGLLSATSPLGSCLLGAAVDDEVEMTTPRATTTYRILEITAGQF